jgi:hypothetical protein
MGDLVLLYHRCTNSGTNWTLSSMCLKQFCTKTGAGRPRDKRLRGSTKTSRTVWSSPSSSYLNTGLHFDTYSILGKRFYIIVNCILIVHDPIVFLPDVVDTTGRVYDDFSRWLFLTLTVNLRLWPTIYRRNRVNFSSFVWLVMLILKGQWVWFWPKLQTWGFPYLLTFHSVHLCLWHALFVGDVLFLF